MKFQQLVVAALILGSSCLLNADTFAKLHFNTGQDTLTGSYRLHLEGPNDPQSPTVWEGPLSISTSTGSCQADLSLITAVWTAAQSSFVIVVADSGSSTYVYFVDPGSCKLKWPSIKAFTEGVRIVADQLEILPGCTCNSAKAPCFCAAAQVYGLKQDSRPFFSSDRSWELTRQQLGIAFAGMRRVLRPKTKSARLLPD